MQSQTPDELQATWSTWTSPSPQALDVVVAGDLAVHWLQVPPADVASLSELKLVAAARCAHLHGGSPQDWWVTGDWSVTRAFVCAGLPRELIGTIARLAEDARLPVRWHTAWSTALRTGRWPADGWSALRTPSGVTLWHSREGLVDCLAARAVDPRAASADVAVQCLGQLQIESLRDSRLLAGTLRWWEACTVEATQALPAGVARVDAEALVAPDEAQAALALYLRSGVFA
jgi:hypothetical protein